MILEAAGFGESLEGEMLILNIGDSNNNNNIQTSNNIYANTDNSIVLGSSLQNSECENQTVCDNFVLHESLIGFVGQGNALTIRNLDASTNTNIQNDTTVESNNGNAVLKDLKLDNTGCDGALRCSNRIDESTFIGDGDVIPEDFGLQNLGSGESKVGNNFNSQNDIERHSMNQNIETANYTLSNHDCQTTAECTNFLNGGSIILNGFKSLVNNCSTTTECILDEPVKDVSSGNSEHNTNTP